MRLAPLPVSVPLLGPEITWKVNGSPLGSVLVNVIALATPWLVVTDWLLATGAGVTVIETVAVLLTRPVVVSVTVNAKLSLPEKPVLGV